MLSSPSEKEAFLNQIHSKKLWTEEDKKALSLLVKDNDPTIRYDLAEALCYIPAEVAFPYLMALLNDEDYLVRANACDSLCKGTSYEIISALFQRIPRERQLFRGYAILTITDVAVNGSWERVPIVEKIKKWLAKESSTWVKICIYSSLYTLGEKDYLTPLLAELDNRYYRNRSAVVHGLSNIIDRNNASVILESVEKRIPKEKTIAVKEALFSFMKKYSSLTSKGKCT